jgi:hypothetical protein
MVVVAFQKMGVTMRFFIALVVVLASWGGCFADQAQEVSKACDIDCLRQKVVELEQAVKVLQEQTKSSIKSGQSVTLKIIQGDHPGGCLTYIGLSGPEGGPVSWSTNCSHGTLWSIN